MQTALDFIFVQSSVQFNLYEEIITNISTYPIFSILLLKLNEALIMDS